MTDGSVDLRTAWSILEWVKLIGGIAGIIAIIWRVYDAFQAYLLIYVDCEIMPKSNRVLVSTRVQNRSTSSKAIDSAFIVVSPEEMDLLDALRSIVENVGDKLSNIDSTNDFARLVSCGKLPDNAGSGDVIFRSLPFYSSENVRIADEDLAYATTINLEKFTEDKGYSVRFYVHDKRRLHRSTQALFVRPSETN